MRFAEAVAILAAVAALPAGAALSGPSMTEEQFLAEVRCVAYQDISDANAPLGGQKSMLNAEATDQPDEIVAQAAREVDAISQLGSALQDEAVREQVREGRWQACESSQRFAGAPISRNG